MGGRIKPGFGFALARIVAALMLFWALDRHPYGYYILLRWVVCAVSAYTALLLSEADKKGWAWCFGIIAVLFNPLIPVHLNRALWALIDIGAAIAFLASFSIPKSRAISPNGRYSESDDTWECGCGVTNEKRTNSCTGCGLDYEEAMRRTRQAWEQK